MSDMFTTVVQAEASACLLGGRDEKVVPGRKVGTVSVEKRTEE